MVGLEGSRYGGLDAKDFPSKVVGTGSRHGCFVVVFVHRQEVWTCKVHADAV